MRIPKATYNQVLGWAQDAIAKDKGVHADAFLGLGFLVVAVRGYFRNSVGVPGTNDVGEWDDACFVLDLKRQRISPFLWNTDPSRLGYNAAIGDGFAILRPGCYLFHKGQHKNAGPAWRQITPDYLDGTPWDGNKYFTDARRLGHFNIWRGQKGSNPHTGYFAINIHWTGASTGSWGCQTATGKPSGESTSPWARFRDETYRLATEGLLPYVLLDNDDLRLV